MLVGSYDVLYEVYFSFFLWSGQVFIFWYFWKYAKFCASFGNDRDLTRAVSHILIMRTDISRKPCVLLLSRDCSVLIFSSLKVNEVILALVTCDLVSVNLLSEWFTLRSKESIKKISLYRKIRCDWRNRGNLATMIKRFESIPIGFGTRCGTT